MQGGGERETRQSSLPDWADEDEDSALSTDVAAMQHSLQKLNVNTTTEGAQSTAPSAASSAADQPASLIGFSGFRDQASSAGSQIGLSFGAGGSLQRTQDGLESASPDPRITTLEQNVDATPRKADEVLVCILRSDLQSSLLPSEQNTHSWSVKSSEYYLQSGNTITLEITGAQGQRASLRVIAHMQNQAKRVQQQGIRRLLTCAICATTDPLPKESALKGRAQDIPEKMEFTFDESGIPDVHDDADCVRMHIWYWKPRALNAAQKSKIEQTPSLADVLKHHGEQSSNECITLVGSDGRRSMNESVARARLPLLELGESTTDDEMSSVYLSESLTAEELDALTMFCFYGSIQSQITINERSLQHLLDIAHRFGCTSLTNECDHHLKRIAQCLQINTYSLADKLIFLHQRHTVQARDKIAAVLSGLLKSLVESDRWDALEQAGLLHLLIGMQSRAATVPTGATKHKSGTARRARKRS